MAKSRKIILTVLVLLLATAVFTYLARDWVERQFFKPTGSSIQEGVNSAENSEIKTIAQNLTVPWGIAFLPEMDILITERSGTLQRISDGKTHNIKGVRHIGEGGLLGLALHPNFKQNRQLYLYLTTDTGDKITNRIERYRYDSDQLTNREVILKGIPGAAYHDGGRIAFGPDGHLYIATGDGGNESLAQNINSLAGKILRVTEDGQIPEDNPFNNEVYSYGHRNPQGLAWDDQDRLWSTEHGRSGIQSGLDELNLIEKGANYGWPVIEGDQTDRDMVTPVVHSGADETWAPASLAYRDGSLFFGGLRGETLYEAVIQDDSSVKLQAHFRGEYGRLRTAAFGPEGKLYLTTSNTDGRGEEKPNDDKLIVIDSGIF